MLNYSFFLVLANQKRVHFSLEGDDEDAPVSVTIMPDKEEEDEEGEFANCFCATRCSQKQVFTIHKNH